MIISRAPVRITLGGGGTDFPSYYEEEEGFTIAGAINKYVFVGASESFYPHISLKYSKLECVNTIDKIKHPLFREALRYCKVNNAVDLVSLADIPAGTGLGSSGAFLTALLNTLFWYKMKNIDRTGKVSQISKRELAQMACKIELDILKLHEGKQDKYICACGGIKSFKFQKDGRVSIISFPNEDELASALQEKLFLFYTGTERKEIASEALKYQDKSCKRKDMLMIDCLNEIKCIGYRTNRAFKKMDLDAFGKLLNDHWEIKKQYSPYTTNTDIDRWYKAALDNGALGGKIMGAGGGGFFLFYHPGNIKERWFFANKMQKLGLQETEFNFDTKGVSTIFKGN